MPQNGENGGQHCALFPPLFAIYYGFAFLFEENLSQICISNHKKMMVKTLAFALHLVPKRIAFCTKTHCILHQNAENRHKKRRVKGYLWANSPLEMKNGLVVFG